MTTGKNRWFLEPRSNGSGEPRFLLVGNFLGQLGASLLGDKLAGTATQPGLNRGYKKMVLDLSRITHMDSEGVLSIMDTFRRLAVSGCVLVLVNVPEQFRHKIELRGLHQVGMSIDYRAEPKAS